MQVDRPFRVLDDPAADPASASRSPISSTASSAGHAFWTTVILLPMMLSPAVVGNFWTFLYQPQIGLFNYVVSFFTGLPPSSFQMIGAVKLAPWAIIIVDTWMWTPYVMLICLAGLRSIPEYHLRSRRGRPRVATGASSGPMTLPMALPFLMLAVLFRGIENFKMFDMVNLLDLGGTRLDDRGGLHHLEARSLREVAHGLLLRLRHHPVRRRCSGRRTST